MAEQKEPIRRRVAVKFIKQGMDTKQVIARFEAERQALAMMDHPNIAKVLDAGTTETGRPYLVMELVRGIKITDYCDQNNLSATQRLELFVPVFILQGLAEYRQGHFASAEDWEGKCLAITNSWDELRVSACMVLALGHKQLNKTGKVQAALLKGDQIAETKLSKVESGDIGEEWVDLLFAHALMREAKPLIDESSRPGDVVNAVDALPISKPFP